MTRRDAAVSRVDLIEDHFSTMSNDYVGVLAPVAVDLLLDHYLVYIGRRSNIKPALDSGHYLCSVPHAAPARAAAES